MHTLAVMMTSKQSLNPIRIPKLYSGAAVRLIEFFAVTFDVIMTSYCSYQFHTKTAGATRQKHRTARPIPPQPAHLPPPIQR